MAKSKDFVKYALLNAVRQTSDANPRTYLLKKLMLFSNLHRICSHNKSSHVKATHLYAIFYSKYYAQRFVLQNTAVEVRSVDDEKIKDQFKSLSERAFVSNKECENAYLECIRSFTSGDVFEAYAELNERMAERKWNVGEEELFLIGCSEADQFLEETLSNHVSHFLKPCDRRINFFKKYWVVNGWIIAGGVSLGIPIACTCMGLC